jgi:hypothetical protein
LFSRQTLTASTGQRLLWCAVVCCGVLWCAVVFYSGSSSSSSAMPTGKQETPALQQLTVLCLLEAEADGSQGIER